MFSPSWQLRSQAVTKIAIGLTVLISAALPAAAIPEAQVMTKIKNVPVYIITDGQGNPIEATSKQKSQSPIVGVFATRQDARSFIDRTLRTQQPDLIKSVQVNQVSLADVYQRQKIAKSKPQAPNYVYVPTVQQKSSAVRLLQQQGQKVQDFAGMPVFMATISNAKGQDVLMTVKRNGKDAIPIFFSQETLQMVMARLYPGWGSKYKVKVSELSGTIDYMISSNDRAIELFEFNQIPDN
jgi:hypothetical protein